MVLAQARSEPVGKLGLRQVATVERRAPVVDLLEVAGEAGLVGALQDDRDRQRPPRAPAGRDRRTQPGRRGRQADRGVSGDPNHPCRRPGRVRRGSGRGVRGGPGRGEQAGRGHGVWRARSQRVRVRRSGRVGGQSVRRSLVLDQRPEFANRRRRSARCRLLGQGGIHERAQAEHAERHASECEHEIPPGCDQSPVPGRPARTAAGAPEPPNVSVLGALSRSPPIESFLTPITTGRRWAGNLRREVAQVNAPFKKNNCPPHGDPAAVLPLAEEAGQGGPFT